MDNYVARARSPAGVGTVDACTLPVRANDLPVGQVLGAADLPVAIDVPGVPDGPSRPSDSTAASDGVPGRAVSSVADAWGPAGFASSGAATG